jgi:hypothetical protein
MVVVSDYTLSIPDEIVMLVFSYLNPDSLVSVLCYADSNTSIDDSYSLCQFAYASDGAPS